MLWRPHQDFSAIGWHLGHQAHVAQLMVRNLSAAEPRAGPALDALMDSATPDHERGGLPVVNRLTDLRTAVAERVHARMADIGEGRVGAPAQLDIVARRLMTTLIAHEYQHDRWISEVRSRDLGHPLPADPRSDRVTRIDGYLMITEPS